MACEKCWSDAFLRAYLSGFVMMQAEAYGQLLEERRDNPCTPEEQRGETIGKAYSTRGTEASTNAQ